jgi:predicted ATPase
MLSSARRQTNGTRRIVVTGGPGGGKTTAADLFRREIGEHVVVVPEAATMLFGGGFPRFDDDLSRRAAQRAIYHVQRNLEDTVSAAYPERILLCDRGTVDGGAYWPGDPDEFLTEVDSDLESELKRYDAVVFFESAAVGGITIEGGNRVRTEDAEQAVSLDRRLRELWRHHSRYTMIRHAPSFLQKITAGLAVLRNVLADIDGDD